MSEVTDQSISPWRVSKAQIAYLPIQEGKARTWGQAESVTPQVLDRSRPPRVPSLWPATPEELDMWIEKRRADLALLAISESSKPITPREIQHQLERWNFLESGSGQTYWKNASKRLRSHPALRLGGRGTRTTFFLPTGGAQDGKTSGPVSKIEDWIFGDPISPPVGLSQTEATRECNLVLGRFWDVLSADELEDSEWKVWRTRLSRGRRLHALFGGRVKIEVSALRRALEECATREGKGPQACLSELAKWSLELAPDAISGRSLPGVSKLEADSVRGPTTRAVGASLPPEEWRRVARHSTSGRPIGVLGTAWLLVSGLEGAAPRSSIDALVDVLLHSEGDVEFWYALGLLDRPGFDTDGAVHAQLVAKLLDSRHTQTPSVRALLRNIERRIQAAREEVEDELSSLRAELEGVAADLEGRAADLSRGKEKLKQEVEKTQAAQRDARNEIGAMATRLEEVRAQGRSEVLADALSEIAEALEVFLDRERDIPRTASEAIRKRLEAALGRYGVHATHSRNETIEFDPALYEWSLSGEPPPLVRVLRRAYVIDGDERITVTKGMVTRANG